VRGARALWTGGVAAGVGAHIGIATPPLEKFGTAEQKARWLQPAIHAETFGALAITEPDAGSDVASVGTARPARRRWLGRQRRHAPSGSRLPRHE
jgi:alkylation response protein AidB-like acyl-CoA dehydrogenase